MFPQLPPHFHIRSLVWLAANLSAAAFVLANRSPLFLAGGSDALIPVYRVPTSGMIAALLLFALGSGIALIPARPRPFPGGRGWAACFRQDVRLVELI